MKRTMRGFCILYQAARDAEQRLAPLNMDGLCVMRVLIENFEYDPCADTLMGGRRLDDATIRLAWRYVRLARARERR